MTGGNEAVRFLDILTTASSVSGARGATSVTAAHLLDAIGVLTGELDLEEEGGMVSPLGRGRTELAADPAVRELTQRWYARLGGTPDAGLDTEALVELRTELELLVRS
jgi:hypothetical protein